jgi:hypothetical protein
MCLLEEEKSRGLGLKLSQCELLLGMAEFLLAGGLAATNLVGSPG